MLGQKNGWNLWSPLSPLPTPSFRCFLVAFILSLFNDLHFQIFMHKSAMQMHARDLHRSEMKPHQCQQCLKSFSSNHQLVQHIRVHTGEKPYKCSYCDRRFKQLSHVQQHTRLHTGTYNQWNSRRDFNGRSTCFKTLLLHCREMHSFFIIKIVKRRHFILSINTLFY